MSPDAVRSDRRDRTKTGRALLAVYVVLIVIVPTIMLREVVNQVILKATVLVVLVMALLGLRTYRAVAAGFFLRGPKPLTWATVAFVAALLVSSALSAQPWVAFSGAAGRGIGAVTYLACMVLLHGVFRDFRDRSVEPLLTALLVGHVVVAGYALVQAFGWDPFDWIFQMAFTGFVFSTLTNPNFSSAFIAITLPLLVRGQFNPSFHWAVRVGCGSAIGASMAAITFMISFQAQVATLAALIVPAVLVLQRHGRRRLETLVHVAPTSVVIVLLPFVLAGSGPGHMPNGDPLPVPLVGVGSVTVLGLIVGLGAWTWLVSWRSVAWTPDLGEARSTPWSGSHRALVAGGVAVAGVGAVLLVWPAIGSEVASGLGHRREMWIVGLRMFRDQPVFGAGLETFFFHFSPLRPVEHAVRFEGILSDNVHNVPLSMFSGGGLLLGFSYLALLIVVAAYGVRALRRSGGAEQLMIAAVAAGWIAYQVQSSVSVDVPGLAYTQWVLAGVLLARGASDGLVSVPFPWARPRSSRARKSPGSASARPATSLQRGLAGGSIVAVLVAGLGPATAPIRADREYRNSQESSARGEHSEAHALLLRAIELQPRNGQYAEALGRAYASAGSVELSLHELERSAVLRPGFAEGERLAARINRDSGDFERAVHWYELALASEPYGPFGLREAARFYATIGESERMNDRLVGYEQLGSDVLTPVIADIYEELGDLENAERVRGG